MRKVSRVVLAAWALIAVCALAACADESSEDPFATFPESTAPLPEPTGSPVPALQCDGLKAAKLGRTVDGLKFSGYASDITLVAGKATAPDGTNVELRTPCAVGDLNLDGAPDALGVVVLNNGGTGRFNSLVAWRNNGAVPVYAASVDLGDRIQVQSVTIMDQQATVVYLTRTPDASMIQLNVKRTAIYRLSGDNLLEISHSDASYTG